MVSIGSPGTSRIRKNASSVIPMKVGMTRLTRVRMKRSIAKGLRNRRGTTIVPRIEPLDEIGPARVSRFGQVHAGRGPAQSRERAEERMRLWLPAEVRAAQRKPHGDGLQHQSRNQAAARQGVTALKAACRVVHRTHGSFVFRRLKRRGPTGPPP